jgi:hypothetical protein
VHVTKSCWLTNVHKEAEGLTLSSDEVILKFFQEGADAIVIETYIGTLFRGRSLLCCFLFFG